MLCSGHKHIYFFNLGYHLNSIFFSGRSSRSHIHQFWSFYLLHHSTCFICQPCTTTITSAPHSSSFDCQSHTVLDTTSSIYLLEHFISSSSASGSKRITSSRK